MYGKTSFIMRFAAVLTLALFISEMASPLAGVGLSSAAAAVPDVQPLPKEAVAWEDVDGSISPARKSNVLFLVESTAVMSFSSKGVMPTVVLNPKNGSGYDHYHDWTETEGEGAEWGKTYQQYGIGIDDINKMMRDATFGMGALPTAWSGVNITASGRNLYGRDIDNSNNWNVMGKSRGSLAADMEYFKNSYYFPFEDAKESAKLHEAYKAQSTGLVKEFVQAPVFRYTGGTITNVKKYVGTRAPHDWSYSGSANITNASKVLPYALVFKDPRYWSEEGAKSAPYSAELVPNDSRMYQAKLVLWNLLREPNLFDNIRVGLASTYLSPVNFKSNLKDDDDFDDYAGDRAYDFHGIFRVSPYGSNLIARTTFQNGSMWDWKSYTTKGPDKRYSGGIMTEAITGQVRAMTRLHGQTYPVWAAQTNELLYDTSASTSDYIRDQRIVYRLLNRASLHVPIRDFGAAWTKGGRSITQADKIRMWINGLADIYQGDRNNNFHFYKDPEIGIAGTYALPMAIFPDTRRSDLNLAAMRNGYVWYSHKDQNRDYKWSVFPSSSQFEEEEFAARSLFNSGSGEATGSVIDFFSPPAGGTINSHGGAMDASELADVSYPITNNCEDNWVILITSGVELKPTSPGAYVYNSWAAIKNLYDYTKNNAVSMRSGTGSARRITSKKLDRPIRTLVIGMVPSTDGVTDAVIKAQIEEMRRNVNRMARAGQGYNYDDESAPVTAFFAGNTEALSKALKDALTFIAENQVQQSSGAMLESPSLGDATGDESFNFYSSMFRIRRDNQWEGYLSRYSVAEADDGTLKTSFKWKLEDKIARGAGRSLRYWSGAKLAALTDGGNYFKEVSGLDTGKMSTSNISAAAFNSYNPHKAMYNWLQGYDHSYAKNTNFTRISMLSDMGQGGIAYVDDPAPANFLPGYEAWAKDLESKKINGAARNDPNIYIQTNDGILHVVDPSTGAESSAIVPPPLLAPSRLAAMKTQRQGNGKLEWIDVLGREGAAGDITHPRSVPLFTLDGALQKRAFSNFDGRDWKMYLLAGLGRGGSGLYMMNVDDHDAPKLMWYKERVGGSLLEMVVPRDSDKPDRPVAAANPDPAFLKLGFNSPKAVMGVTGPPDNMSNIIVLAGGMQNSIDLSRNGGEGAVLLILDPETGNLIRGFTPDDVVNGSAVGTAAPGRYPAMGMMVSEPTLMRTARRDIEYWPYLAGSIYAADNRGTIFRVDLERVDDDGSVISLSPNEWKISAAATLQRTAEAAKSSSSGYALPFGVQLMIQDDYTWIAGGTGDLRGKKSGAYPTGVLQNAGQMIFAFRTAKGEGVHGADSLKNVSGDALLAADYEKYHGWKIPLASPPGYGAQYVSAKPLAVNGVLYAATFMEKKILTDNASQLCDSRASRIDGTARLYVMDLMSGSARWRVGQYATMNGAKITGITLSTQGKRQRIVITYDKLRERVNLDGAEGAARLDDLNAFVLNAPSPGTIPGGAGLSNAQNVIQYWLRN